MIYIDNPPLQKQRAEATKKKREDIVFGNTPYLCRFCGVKKLPKEFAAHRMDNYWVGKYRYLYECKECKKKRTYAKRLENRSTLQGAMNVIFKQLSRGAKQRNLAFELTFDSLLQLREDQQGFCYYTGYPMEYEFVHHKSGSQSEKTKYQISCDRLDPDRGYEQGNVVLCCTLVNRMKNILSEEEFYQVCNDIIKKKKTR